MKTTCYIIGSVILFLALNACSSTRSIVDDNVYMLRAAAIPIGENLLDETSYATFKYREEQNNPTTGYYSPSEEISRNNTSNSSMSTAFFYIGTLNYFNNVIGFNESLMSFPYSHYNSNGFYNPYGFYNPNSFYGQYGNYGSFYNPSNNNWYNNSSNGGLTFSSSTGSKGHFVSGPRSTTSGYYSGVSRGGSQQLKSPIQNGYNNPFYPNEPPTYSAQMNTGSRPGTNNDFNQRGNFTQKTVPNNNRKETAKFTNEQARPVLTRSGNSSHVSNSTTHQRQSSAINSPSHKSSTLPGSNNSSRNSTPNRPNTSSGGGIKRN